MEAVITFADGTDLTVDNLFAHVAELEGKGLNETNPADMVRRLFALDPEVAEVTVDPNGEPLTYAPSREDFGEGWGE
jgi:hypothetical protein